MPLKTLKQQLLKQQNIASWWGWMKFMGQHIQVYIQILILIFSGGTFYGVLWLWMHENFGIELPLWGFVLTILVAIGVAVLFEWKISLPGFMAAWNWQWWTHSNPMKKDVEEIHKKLDKLLEEKDDTTKRPN